MYYFRPHIAALLLCAAVEIAATTRASATTFEVDSVSAGCTVCDNYSIGLFVGETITYTGTPIFLTLSAGDHTITKVTTTEYFKGYTTVNFLNAYDWNFVLAKDNGNGTGTIFEIGGSPNTYGNPDSAYNNVPVAQGFFNLAVATTFALFTPDNYPPDNIGGIAIDVTGVVASATPLPAALPFFAGGLGVIGLLARRRKQKAAATLAAA